MEGRSKLFVDSNYFIALSNPSDALHRPAREIATILEEESLILIISNFIFLEVVTVLAQKGGKEIANEGGRYLLSHPFIEKIHIDEWLQSRSWEIFQEIYSKNVSFVDCSIIAVMKSEGITQLLTFDTKDFTPLQKHYNVRFYQG